jgi:putative flippase GtrA
MIKNIVKFIKWSLKIFFKLPEKLRFFLMGGFNTVSGYLIFLSFYFLFKNILHYQVILFTSYLPTTFISFLTFKFFVFRTKGKWTKEYLRVLMSSILVYLTNTIVLHICVEIFKIYIPISQFVSIFFVTITSYTMHKYFSFQVHLIDR